MPDAADSTALTDAEREMLDLAATGLTDDELAAQLDATRPWVRAAWASVREKLGAVNRTHAIALACGGVDQPVLESPLTRLAASLEAGRLARWVFLLRSDELLLDVAAERLFALPPSDGAPVPLTVLLGRVWNPDRTRFERYLRQAPDLRPMTPIEVKAGEAGAAWSLVRTVNLAAEAGKSPVVVLASTLA